MLQGAIDAMPQDEIEVSPGLARVLVDMGCDWPGCGFAQRQGPKATSDPIYLDLRFYVKVRNDFVLRALDTIARHEDDQRLQGSTRRNAAKIAAQIRAARELERKP